MLVLAVLVSLALALALIAAMASSSARRNDDIPLSVGLSLVSLALAAFAGWASIPRLLRSINILRLFSSLHFRINQGGALFLGFIFLISLAAMNSGNNLLFLLLAVFLSIILSSGIYSRINLRGIDLAVFLPEMIYARQETAIRIVLKNTKLLWGSFGVSLEGFQKWRYIAEEDEKKSSFFHRPRLFATGTWRHGIEWKFPIVFPILPAGKTVSVVLKSRFLSRGRYQPEPFFLTTSYPFGFFKKGMKSPSVSEILVFPMATGEEKIQELWFTVEGEESSGRKGLSGQFHSHRAYLSGEGVRNMDWKASAKSGVLLLKEFSREEQPQVHIVLDSLVPAGEEEKKDELFEKMVSDAAGIARSLVLRGATVGLTANGRTCLPERGNPDMSALMGILALVQRRKNAEGQRDAEKLATTLRSLSGSCEILLLTAQKGGSPTGFPRHWKVAYDSLS